MLPPSTGSRETALAFYQGLVDKDWQKSYDLLDVGSKKQWNLPAFKRRAEAYRARLGFDPEQAHVQTCEEKGIDAIAHVVVTGRAATKSKRFKDAVAVQKAGDEWRVVLPASIGGK